MRRWACSNSSAIKITTPRATAAHMSQLHRPRRRSHSRAARLLLTSTRLADTSTPNCIALHVGPSARDKKKDTVTLPSSSTTHLLLCRCAVHRLLELSLDASETMNMPAPAKILVKTDYRASKAVRRRTVPIQWKRGKPTPTTCMLRLVSLTRVPFYSTTQLLHRANVLMYIFSGAELYTRNGLARCESPHAYVRAAPLVGLRLTTYLAADTPHLSKQRLRSPCQLYPAPGHTPSNRPVLVATASHLHRSPPSLYSPAYHLS